MLAACAHRPSAEETSAGFRALSRQEAALARAEAVRGQLRDDATHAALEDATAAVCGQSEALCATSRTLHDRDADARCTRASDTCSGARAHLHARLGAP